MSGKDPATLSSSLLARKGGASATGFTQVFADRATEPPAVEDNPLLRPLDRQPERGPHEAADDDDAPRAHQARPPQRFAAKTILIVEDNESNLLLFKELLEIHGGATLLARNGEEAWQMAKHTKPDLILMDIGLPEASGTDVIERIKGEPELGHIPVIAVTAFAMAGEEARIRKSGCQDYIAKPIEIAAFIDTLEKHLA